jgi:nucleotide-binding universal stress UspA family protein
MTGFTNILHPTDFSEPSQAAWEKAVDLARQCGAKVTVLHVYANPLMAEGFAYVPDPRPELEEKLNFVANEELPIAVERELRVGLPAEEIVAYAREHNCDLIVMGTHGRTGLSHLLMGSVASTVVRRAPCPVMVVRPQPGGEGTMPRRAERAHRSVVVV